ncbi:hypothetical protein N8I77_005829 [Diaporthe amygdali]|uniref:Protein kinase domain-containing protein n=1 Tax=Phomopsis amygdali TaxID=1214568 RepID=A0AAD9SGQ0_PHOAM|nr:hypothetical protein N8I77_005829 [Diaporthe amygdali]
MSAAPVQPPLNPPGQAPPVDSGSARLEDLQSSQDRFEHYWTGRYSWWRAEHAAGRRRAHYIKLQAPKPRPPGPRPQVQPDAPRLDVDGNRVAYQPLGQNNSRITLLRYMVDILNGSYQIMNYMRPTGFRLVKILGKGGFGIACLFEMRDTNGKTHKFVVKAGTGRDLQTERANLRLMAGARHIVQQKRLQAMPEPESIERAPSRAGNLYAGNDPAFVARLFDANLTMLGMEFMKNGDVHNLLRKAAAQQKSWKSRELWLIFHCLFRGCVALAYPDTWTGGRDPECEDIILQEEAVPLVNGKPTDQSGALVHFDLDPQNGEYLVEHGLDRHLRNLQ